MQKVSESRKQLTAADKKNQLATTSKLEKKETRCRNLWTRGQISDGFSSFDYSVEPVGRYFFVSFVLFPLRRMGAEATLCSTCIAAGWWISCADLSIFFWWRAPFSFFFFTENFVCAYLADVSRDGRTHLLDHCAVHLAAVYCPSRQSR